MSDERTLQLVTRALEVAGKAWNDAHRGLPSNPMTKAAAIPATGILAAALMDQLDGDDRQVAQRAERAIAIARRAWEATHREPPGNPIAATAARSVVGIIAAGILNHWYRNIARADPLQG